MGRTPKIRRSSSLTWACADKPAKNAKPGDATGSVNGGSRAGLQLDKEVRIRRDFRSESGAARKQSPPGPPSPAHRTVKSSPGLVLDLASRAALPSGCMIFGRAYSHFCFLNGSAESVWRVMRYRSSSPADAPSAKRAFLCPFKECPGVAQSREGQGDMPFFLNK